MTAFNRDGFNLSFAPTLEEDELDAALLRGPLGGADSTPAPLTGTRALMLAVLEDAIRCYLDGARRDAEEAEDWIRDNWRGSPFAFVVVCETLHLDPQATRRMLTKMRDEKTSSREAIPRARNNVRVPGRVCGRKPSREPKKMRHAS